MERGTITHSQYVALLANLQRQRVGFVSIGEQDLLRAADDDKLDDLTALIGALCAPRVEQAGLLRIAIEFITSLWREEKYAAVKIRMTSSLLSSLVVGRRDGLYLARLIIAGVAETIREFPRPLHMLSVPWSDYVDAFLRGHFIRKAILPPQMKKGRG